MKNTIEKILKKYKKIFNYSNCIIDIETVDFNNNGKIEKLIYNIGILEVKTKKGLSITNKDILELIIKNRNNMKNLKLYYDNLETSLLLRNYYIENFLNEIIFNKLIGYNIINFDIPILKQFYNIKYFQLIDLYFLISLALPLKYLNYCQENKYITDKGNPIFNAEVVYKFIKKDNYFKERHTALYDCLIELEIYNYVKKRIGIKEVKCQFNFYNVWRNFIKRFKKINWNKDSYFKKLIIQEV